MRRFWAAIPCSIVLTIAAVALFLSTIEGVGPHPVFIRQPWWTMPVYGVLRAVPTKLGAVIAAIAAAFGFFLLPWIVVADAKRRLYRPVALFAAAAFLAAIVVLGSCGAHDPDTAAFAGAPGPFLLGASLNSQMWLSRVAAAYYLAYIVAIAPALGWRRKADPAAVFA